jgi:hypothetical protein
LRRKSPKQYRLPSIIASSPISIANAPEKNKKPFTVVSFAAMIILILETRRCPNGPGCGQH